MPEPIPIDDEATMDRTDRDRCGMARCAGCGVSVHILGTGDVDLGGIHRNHGTFRHTLLGSENASSLARQDSPQAVNYIDNLSKYY
ncbi:hypothetical protein [Kocuria sp. HSID16901]|uniref:hypothetical protein n=1 Tax=Kocuria sp. HSID16901 TaxID=2419505 RepID=UPI000F891CDF|nr:hypothetical protein [Kocuria sp. HSID16901]